MKNLLITFFTVLFCLTSSVGWSLEYKDLVKRDGIYYKSFTDVPFTGEVTGKKNGSFKNGKKEGSWFNYHDNGQLWGKGNFKNGFQNGYWEGYWFNGQISFKGNYKNGNKEGFWIKYYKTGQLESEGEYIDNKIEGYFIEYRFDGIVLKEYTGTYKNGKKISD